MTWHRIDDPNTPPPMDGTHVDLHDGEIRYPDCFSKMGVWFRKAGWPVYDQQVVGCTHWTHTPPPPETDT